jgi:DNA-binding Xre family transcriptional regulator
MNRIICYKKLWKLLIDRGLNKVELQRRTGVSSATITKLAKNETVNTRVLTQICNALDCDVSDIMAMEDHSTAHTGMPVRLKAEDNALREGIGCIGGASDLENAHYDGGKIR